MRTPLTVEEMGVGRKHLEDLALKTIYMLGEVSLIQLSEHMKVSLKIAEELFARLRKDQMVRVTGMVGGVHQCVPSTEGKNRALELLSLNQYTGPAPVSYDDYVTRIRQQSVRQMGVSSPALLKAFEELVLDPHQLDQIGTAVISGRAIFLYGPPGTGKTTVAETIWRLFQSDPVWVPHAISIEGQIISVYDPHTHQDASEPIPPDADRRWMLVKRPRVVVGGELTIEMLDLQFNPVSKFYTAPVQLKANNGLLIIDDFGRQRVRPEELLNRWVVPLDRNIDFLTLSGGRKIEVPFDALVVFATNLDPTTLVDEAFLRRIQTKIKLDNVNHEQFHEIMRRVCRRNDLPYDAPVVDHLIDLITGELKQPLRSCYPCDIVNQIIWAARYERRQPELSRETIEQACRNYFIAPDSRGLRGGPTVHRGSGLERAPSAP
jgi:predicted ATPase with chaperone activity